MPVASGDDLPHEEEKSGTIKSGRDYARKAQAGTFSLDGLADLGTKDARRLVWNAV